MAAGLAGVEVHPERIFVWPHKGGEDNEKSETILFLDKGHANLNVSEARCDSKMRISRFIDKILMQRSNLSEKDVLSQDEVMLEIDLAGGCTPEAGQSGEGHVWTTDLPVEYFQENS